MSGEKKTEERPPLWRRGLTITVTAGVAAVAVGAAITFSNVMADRADAVAGPAPMPPTLVDTVAVTRTEFYTQTRSFVGQVEPSRQVSVGFETGGTLEDVLVAEGDVVFKGDVLARLDTRLLRAEERALKASQDALRAQADLAQATADRQEALQERGFASNQRFDEARFSLASLEAEIAQLDARLVGLTVQIEKAELRAPFDGKIGARAVDPGQTVASGQAIVRLLDNSAPEFRVGLPLDLARELKPDQRGTVEFGGLGVDATLSSLRPDIDPATRTQIAIFVLEGDTPAFGASGMLKLSVDIPADGYWVPLSALVEATRGTWSVFTVAESGLVERHGVELLHVDAGRAYVTGALPDRAQVIASGTHRVIPGQSVALAEG